MLDCLFLPLFPKAVLPLLVGSWMIPNLHCKPSLLLSRCIIGIMPSGFLPVFGVRCLLEWPSILSELLSSFWSLSVVKHSSQLNLLWSLLALPMLWIRDLSRLSLRLSMCMDNHWCIWLSPPDLIALLGCPKTHFCMLRWVLETVSECTLLFPPSLDWLVTSKALVLLQLTSKKPIVLVLFVEIRILCSIFRIHFSFP